MSETDDLTDRLKVLEQAWKLKRQRTAAWVALLTARAVTASITSRLARARYADDPDDGVIRALVADATQAQHAEADATMRYEIATINDELGRNLWAHAK